MKITDGTPLLYCSVESFLQRYFSDGYILDPGVFSLSEFSAEHLIAAEFEKFGSNNFSSYEKGFRIAGSKIYVRVKFYFMNELFESNGIDFYGCRMSTVLRKYSRSYGFGAIDSLEVRMDESHRDGSIIVNGQIDLRFGVNWSGIEYKKQFSFVGISSDVGRTQEFSKKKY